jgi:hypothetical protein
MRAPKANTHPNAITIITIIPTDQAMKSDFAVAWYVLLLDIVRDACKHDSKLVAGNLRVTGQVHVHNEDVTDHLAAPTRRQVKPDDIREPRISELAGVQPPHPALRIPHHCVFAPCTPEKHQGKLPLMPLPMRRQAWGAGIQAERQVPRLGHPFRKRTGLLVLRRTIPWHQWSHQLLDDNHVGVCFDEHIK